MYVLTMLTPPIKILLTVTHSQLRFLMLRYTVFGSSGGGHEISISKVLYSFGVWV
jgi:hypothetical protein